MASIPLRRVEMTHPTATTIRALVDLLVDAEKRLAAGPWDEWDEKVLVAWRDEARETLHHALRHL